MALSTIDLGRTSRIGSPAVDPDFIYLGSPEGISAYADQQTDAANTYLMRLGDATAGLTPPVIDPEFPDGPTAPLLTVTTPPEMETVVWTAPTAPAAFTGTLDVNDLLPEPFEDSPPELIFGSAPTFTDTAPDAPPIDTSYEMPELSLTLPTAPDLLSLSITPFDGVSIPTVDFEIPDLDVAAPSIREYTPGAEYTSALLTSLKTTLQDRIDNGGTGLDADVENAIWDRGREREARARDNSLRELDRMEGQGFALPTGVYADARLKIITEAEANDRGTSREIMIKQAELEQSNVLAALTTSTQLEGQLITY
jgi:hypothetical protein